MRNSNSKLCPEPESWTPESLPLNDDTRLERVRLVEESPYTGPTADIAMMLLGSYLYKEFFIIMTINLSVIKISCVKLFSGFTGSSRILSSVILS